MKRFDRCFCCAHGRHRLARRRTAPDRGRNSTRPTRRRAPRYNELKGAEARRDQGIEPQAGERTAYRRRRQASEREVLRPADDPRAGGGAGAQALRRRDEALERPEVRSNYHAAAACGRALALLLVGATFIALSPIFVSPAPTSGRRRPHSGAWRSPLPPCGSLLLVSRRANPVSGQWQLLSLPAWPSPAISPSGTGRSASPRWRTPHCSPTSPRSFVTARRRGSSGASGRARTFLAGLGARARRRAMLVQTSLAFSSTALCGRRASAW